MNKLLKAMNERFEYLKLQEDTHETRGRIKELTLVMSEAHNLLLSELTTTTKPALSLSYWEQRCLLAEKCIEESPCDPDITKSQIEAFDAHRVFIENAKPAQVTHPLTPQEEAEQMSSVYGYAISVHILNYTISALQLRGLSTSYEEEVLTILKGM